MVWIDSASSLSSPGPQACANEQEVAGGLVAGNCIIEITGCGSPSEVLYCESTVGRSGSGLERRMATVVPDPSMPCFQRASTP